jgi:hypothetical protein
MYIDIKLLFLIKSYRFDVLIIRQLNLFKFIFDVTN